MKRKLMAILFLGMAFWIGGQTAWAGTAVYSNPVLGYQIGRAHV